MVELNLIRSVQEYKLKKFFDISQLQEHSKFDQVCFEATIFENETSSETK